MSDKEKYILSVTAKNLPIPVISIDQLWQAGVNVDVRNVLEEDNTYRQVIPYVLIASNDDVLLYSRTKAGGEEELFNKASIGFGGHIDDEVLRYATTTYTGFLSAILTSMHRELVEEVGQDISLLQCLDALNQPLGFLTHDTTPEDRHVGIVLQVEVPDLMPYVTGTNDASIEGRRIINIETLLKNPGGLEAWSVDSLKLLAAKKAKQL